MMNKKEYMVHKHQNIIDGYQDDIDAWENVLRNANLEVDDIDCAFPMTHIRHYADCPFIEIDGFINYAIEINENSTVKEIYDIIDSHVYEMKKYVMDEKELIYRIELYYDEFDKIINDFVSKNNDWDEAYYRKVFIDECFSKD